MACGGRAEQFRPWTGRSIALTEAPQHGEGGHGRVVVAGGGFEPPTFGL